MGARRFGLGWVLGAALFACGDDAGSDSDLTPPTFGDWTATFDASATGWLLSVWGPSDDRLFAVGGEPGTGVIMEQVGGAWSPMALPANTPALNWVYGFGPDQVWAVGDGGTALFWDGSAWTAVPTPTEQNLWGVWGAAPDDVWAVGGGTTPPSDDAEPVVLRWDGQVWSAVPMPQLIPASARQMFKVWGTSPDNVLVVGARGVILRWDGDALVQDTDRPVDHSDDYVSLWGTGPDRIVVVGGRANAQIAAWDGQSWSDVPLPRNPGLNGIWMARPDIFYTVGVRGIAATVRLAPAADGVGLESEVLQQVPVPDISGIDLHAVFGTADGRLFSVGGNFADAGGPYRGAAVTAEVSGGS